MKNTQIEIPAVSIICSGNWLISYDRIGPEVYELIREKYSRSVEVHNSGSSGLALLDHLNNQKLLIVVDACVKGEYPGEIQIIESDNSTSPGSITSVHQAGPLETLGIARKLYPEQMPERVLLILVCTKGLDDAGEKKAAMGVVAAIDRELENYQ